MLSKKKGFSLLEIVIVLGIISIVMGGVTAMMQQMGNLQKQSEEKVTVDSLITNVKMALSSPSMCKLNLQGQVLPTTAGATLDVDRFYYLNTSGDATDATRKLIEVNQTQHKTIKIVDMKFKDVQVTGTSSRTAKLEIDLQSPYIMRNSIIKREIPVSLSVNPTTGEITNCNALNSVDAATSIDGSCPAMTPDEIKSSQMMLQCEELEYVGCGPYDSGHPGYRKIASYYDYYRYYPSFPFNNMSTAIATEQRDIEGSICYRSRSGYPPGPNKITYQSGLPTGYPTQTYTLKFDCEFDMNYPSFVDQSNSPLNYKKGSIKIKCENGQWMRACREKSPEYSCSPPIPGGDGE